MARFNRPCSARAQLVLAFAPVLLARIGALAAAERRMAKGRATSLPTERRAAYVDASAEAGTLARARAGRAEIRAFHADAKAQGQARANAGALGFPVSVLSATKGPEQLRTRWTELQAEVAASSPLGGHRIVDGSGHAIHIERPDTVLVAIDAVVLAVA